MCLLLRLGYQLTDQLNTSLVRLGYQLNMPIPAKKKVCGGKIFRFLQPLNANNFQATEKEINTNNPSSLQWEQFKVYVHVARG